MNRTGSAPALSAPTSSNGFRSKPIPVKSSSSSSHVLSGNSQPPFGVSPLVAHRMRLDAMMAPSTLELRINPTNLLNEMNLHGKIISHQFALMKPRRKVLWGPQPKGLREKELSVSRQVARLQKRVEKKQIKSKPDASADSNLEEKSNDQAHRNLEEDEEDYESRRPSIEDPNLDIEISRLLEDARLEEVWRTLQGSPLTDEELAAGTVPGLQRNRVMRALQALGHTKVDQKKLDECLAALPGGNALDLNEFTSVAAVFNRRRRNELKEQFNKLDEDGSGTISEREFKHFLWDLGFTVTPEVVVEYLNEADANNSGEVDIEEFEKACLLVHQRHGFSSQEVAEYDRLFDRYDTDESHEMEADELASAMGWLGSPLTLDEAKQIIRRYDSNDDGTLAKPEFLMVMRQRLEDEISRMKSLFAEFDRNCEGSLSITAVLELFMKIGYSITAGVVEDAMKQGMPIIYKKGRWRDHNFVFEEVLHLYHLIRDREGFADKETAELADVFNRHDNLGRGELREFEFARCLNWLGYPLSPHRRRELWCRVDVDKTESIELHEFLKLIRILREEETINARHAMEQCRREGLGTHLSEPILKQMLLRLGYSSGQGIIDLAIQQSGDSSGDGNLDIQGILSILRFIRDINVKKLRANAGIPEIDAAKIKVKYALRLDAGKAIDLQEFENTMHDLFPVAVHEQIERDKIRALIKNRVKDSKDGIKSLMDAYWIVRLYGDMLDEAKWQLEQEAAREAGFTKWQVASFREAFVAADINGDGVLSSQEIQAVFDDLLSLNLTQIDTMQQEFHRLADRKDCITFSEFLNLMHIILYEGR